MSDHDDFELIAGHVRTIATELLLRYFMERCLDFDPNCENCKRWRALDALLKNPF